MRIILPPSSIAPSSHKNKKYKKTCHVTRSTACGGQNVELVAVDDSRQAKVGDEQIRVLFGGTEKKILGFQIYE